MIRALLTDIEGTTSSISFVKDVLFPYAAEKLPVFVRENAHDKVVADQLETMWQAQPELRADLDASIQQLLTWIANDEKRTPLKTLQGLIWRTGYEQGNYHAHVYDDASAALKNWHSKGLPLYVYSSGSIAAQKLFFKHSAAGDLSNLFKGHFDTTTGAKQDTTSYHKICEAIGCAAEEILFLSDIPAELDAAATAGMRTTLLVRPEDCPLSTEALASIDHPQVSSFSEIELD